MIKLVIDIVINIKRKVSISKLSCIERVWYSERLNRFLI